MPQLEIEIPAVEEIIARGRPVPLSRSSWSASCLGQHANDSGVYVIHHAGAVKYVGKTNSPRMSFGARLRREFQQAASGGKHLYPQLASLTVPPDIMASLYCRAEIEKMVRGIDLALGSVQVTEIFEVILIEVLQPDFQRHHIKRLARHLHKRFNLTPEKMTSVITEIMRKGKDES